MTRKWITRDDLTSKVIQLQEKIDDSRKEAVLLRLERDGNRQIIETMIKALYRHDAAKSDHFLELYEANKNV